MIDQTGRWYPDYPGQQPQHDPAWMRMMGFTGQGTGNQTASGRPLSPPTIHADIIQYDQEDEVDRFPLAVETPQMFMSRDEQTFLIKTVHQNGQFDKVRFVRQAPEPPAPTLNPAEYVRKDELESLVSALASRGGTQHEPV